MVFVVELDPVFVFGRAPAAESAKPFEVGEDFPYSGHVHDLSPSWSFVLEQRSILLAEGIKCFVGVFRKNEGFQFDYLQF